jgi:5-methylcytosine-specific restriction enzyme B
VSDLSQKYIEVAAAAAVVLDHMLGDRRSVVDPTREVWTAEIAERLRTAVEDSLEVGSDKFYVKFERQLAEQERDVKLLAAEITYLREVPLYNVRPETKQEHVATILSWIPDQPAIPDSMIEGTRNPTAFHGGIGYSQYAWKHIVWVCKFVKVWDGLTDGDRAKARSDPWVFRSIVQLDDDVPAIRNALLFLRFPQSFEACIRDQHKKAMRDAFAHEIEASRGDDPIAVDRDLLAIRGRLDAENGEPVDFYEEPYLSAWSAQDKARGGRAWAVRTRPAGRELVEAWLSQGFVSLAGSRLAALPDATFKDGVREAIAEAYDHVDYAQRLNLTEDYYAFLARMREDDIVVARHDDEVWLGQVVGGTEYAAEEPHLRRPVEWEVVSLQVGDLPAPVPNLLGTPSRSVIDLTDAHDYLQKVLVVVEDEVDEPGEPELDQVLPSSSTVKPDLRRATDELARLLNTDRAWLDEYIGLLEARQQVIVHGPPGTGKTYLANKIGRFVAGDEAVRVVQFHPSYAYEDFFEGFRPRAQTDGSLTFDKVPGPLRRMAAAARSDPGSAYILVIDEINRGNLAKVFGELYFLLEYRDESINLQYSPDEQFTLPKNLFIIGTMNTADRSIAMVDAAIRRRFAFIEMHPDVEPVSGLLGRWLSANQRDGRRADLLAALNHEIGDEDRDFKIGPSYLMRPEADAEEGLERIWRHDILPLLEEHYYGRLTRGQIAATFSLDVLRRRLVPAEIDSEGEPTDQSGDSASGT